MRNVFGDNETTDACKKKRKKQKWEKKSFLNNEKNSLKN